METKDEMKRRGLDSPDRADAVCLAIGPGVGSKTPKPASAVVGTPFSVSAGGRRGVRSSGGDIRWSGKLFDRPPAGPYRV